MIQDTEGVSGAYLATLDGHLISCQPARSANEHVAPMAGSFVGLADAMTGPLELGPLGEAMIRTHQNLWVGFKLGDREDVLILCLVAKRNANLGLLLSKGRTCADEVSQLLKS